MGLTTDIQKDLAEAFDGDLADAVKSFSITQFQKGQYDPNTGDVGGTSTTTTSRGVFTDYTQPEILNSEIEPTDEKLIILQNELSILPAIANEVTKEPNTSMSKKYRVVNVSKDPANATWELQVRSTL